MGVARARVSAAGRDKVKVMAVVRVRVGAARAVAGVRDAAQAGVTRRRVVAASKGGSFGRAVASARGAVLAAGGARGVATVAAMIFRAAGVVLRNRASAR